MPRENHKKSSSKRNSQDSKDDKEKEIVMDKSQEQSQDKSQDKADSKDENEKLKAATGNTNIPEPSVFETYDKEQEKKTSTVTGGGGGTSGKELPRRCVVIRRTHPAVGVEKTELRLVVYTTPSLKKLSEVDALADAAEYLRQRANDISMAENSVVAKTETTTTKMSSSMDSNGSSGAASGNTESVTTKTETKTVTEVSRSVAGASPSVESSLVSSFESHNEANKRCEIMLKRLFELFNVVGTESGEIRRLQRRTSRLILQIDDVIRKGQVAPRQLTDDIKDLKAATERVLMNRSATV